MKVVYGHTDSIYVQIDSVEKAQEAIKDIEASVREHFPNVMGLDNHPVVLEFEKYYSSLGVGTTKNRNAGLVSWEDGVWLDKPKFSMTGFTAKRVSETKLAKEVQTDALKWWVSNDPIEVINARLHRIYTEVLTGQYPVENVIKRSRLRANRTTVKCFGTKWTRCSKQYPLKKVPVHCEKCSNKSSNFLTLEGKRPTIGSGIAGVVKGWSDGIEFDDSYLFLKVKGNYGTYTNPLTKEKRLVEYVAGTTYEDFDDYKPDWEHYADQVIKKAEPIYKAMNWDISSIRTGRIQKSLEEWF